MTTEHDLSERCGYTKEQALNIMGWARAYQELEEHGAELPDMTDAAYDMCWDAYEELARMGASMELFILECEMSDIAFERRVAGEL